MNEQQKNTVDLLNRLYEAEMQTLLPRLIDLGLAISRRHPVDGALVRRIAQESKEHREWLIEEIQANRGSVVPATLDIRSAGLHYSSADAILPQVQGDLERLISLYAQSAARSGFTPSGSELVRRIGRRYEAALDALRQNNTATLRPNPV